MKILCLFNGCDGLGLVNKIQDEGHSVKLFLTDNITAGNGIFNKVDSWRKHLAESQLIVSGSPDFSGYEKVFQEYGKPYLGCSYLGKHLMLKKREEFLAQCGVAMCSNFEHKAMLHGFFNGRDWVRPILFSVIDSHLFPGSLGPEVGCMGCTLRSVAKEPEFLDQIAIGLRKLGLRDFVSIPFNAAGEVFNVVPGLFHDVLVCIAEGLKGSFSDLLFETAIGAAKEMNFTKDYVISVRVGIPPFPYKWQEEVLHTIVGLSEENLRHIYLDDVCKLNGDYQACSFTGETMRVAARGRTVREAQRRAYRTINNLDIPNKQFRVDIGKMAIKLMDGEFKEIIDV